MKNGYDQFFKNARKAAAQPQQIHAKRTGGKVNAQLNVQMSDEAIEQSLKRKMKIAPKPKKKKSFPLSIVLFLIVGLGLTGWAMQNHQQVENFVKNIEISLLGQAVAQEAKAKPVATQQEEPKKTEPIAESTEEKRAPTSDEVDHLAKLNDRKKELDAREEELVRMESELQKQKEQMDLRMKELEEMRIKISAMLQDRVKVDEQKIETLVQMYSNMKPQQAAKVFETLDEDLAIEILGRMKKKSAADIMNLLKPEKAQVFSEHFAGFKRKN